VCFSFVHIAIDIDEIGDDSVPVVTTTEATAVSDGWNGGSQVQYDDDHPPPPLVVVVMVIRFRRTTMNSNMDDEKLWLVVEGWDDN
jgi:hypothetical protein